MFTGIVSAVGHVRALEKRGDMHIVIGAPFDTMLLEIGASIACSGCCLTVVERDGSSFAVTASSETLGRTTLGDWKAGDPVNLERPLKIGDELGGHIVSGHVDAAIDIADIRPDGESLRFTFSVPPALTPYIASKGSVALDGVSLTVNEVQNDRFSVNVIPHTARVTTFGHAKPGTKVNLEVDLLARYVARIVRA